MGEWKAQDRTVCIRGTVVCGQAEDDAECGIIVDAHNDEMRTLTAERDRLAAENAELKRKLDWAEQIAKAQQETSNGTACAEERAAGNGGCGACSWCCSAANATLDRLREVVPEVLPPHMSWKDSLDGARAILYPPETTDDDR